MSWIEMSSGTETIITAQVHYGFHWMADHWKQEIVGVGACQSIPRVWSVEGPVSQAAPPSWLSEDLASQGSPPTTASPAYQKLDARKDSDSVTIARLAGHWGARQSSATFTFREQTNEVVVDVEVEQHGGQPGEMPMATYLVESSSGHLERQGSATITWPHPDTRLVFEAEAPTRVEAHEAGIGTIRLRAIAPHDPSSEFQTLRYRWRWITKPGRQIWDREV
jgi:hypothetical protein